MLVIYLQYLKLCMDPVCTNSLSLSPSLLIQCAQTLSLSLSHTHARTHARTHTQLQWLTCSWSCWGASSVIISLSPWLIQSRLNPSSRQMCIQFLMGSYTECLSSRLCCPSSLMCEWITALCCGGKSLWHSGYWKICTEYLLASAALVCEWMTALCCGNEPDTLLSEDLMGKLICFPQNCLY